MTALLAWGLTGLIRTPPAPRATLVAVFPVQFTETPDTPGLESILPETIASQVRVLPGVRVLAVPLVRAEVTRRFGVLPSELDSLLALASSLGASHVLSGTATSSGRLLTSFRVTLHDISGELLASGETSGPLDSMHVMVGHVVRETVVDEIVNEDILGYASALPRGPIAIPAYYNGIRAFKRSEFGQAIVHFDTVIVKRQSGRLDGGIEGVYNLFDYKPERDKMMRAWSAYLDQLRIGGNVVLLNKGAA